MRKAVFNFIKDKLEGMDGNPIKHIELYSSQISNYEEERPFPVPAVLVKFDPIQWKMFPGKGREAEIIVSLYVITNSRVALYSEALEALDLLEDINRTLDGAKDEQSGIGKFVCDSSITDDEFDELMINIEKYSLRIYDRSLTRETRIPSGSVKPVISS